MKTGIEIDSELAQHILSGGPCYFCGQPCGADDWCFGCYAFVCSRCETVTSPPTGIHTPEAHKRVTVNKVKV